MGIPLRPFHLLFPVILIRVCFKQFCLCSPLPKRLDAVDAEAALAT